jgi:3',5'-cyclic AMP phosphodiesterase CpdA
MGCAVVKLFAISDLHLGVATNRAALEMLPEHAGDWLIVGGDVAEKLEQVEHAWKLLTARFAKVIWTPGNHELWSTNENDVPLRGVAKYDALVELARRYGVLTP